MQRKKINSGNSKRNELNFLGNNHMSKIKGNIDKIKWDYFNFIKMKYVFEMIWNSSKSYHKTNIN